MNKIFFFIALLVIANSMAGQKITLDYLGLISKADSLYNAKDYKQSGYTYSDAFKSNNWKGSLADRYNAACSWSMAGYKDSAFKQLFKVAKYGHFYYYDRIVKDSDLIPLQKDKRWQELIIDLLQEKSKYKTVIAVLDSISMKISGFYLKEDSIAKLYGWESVERTNFYATRNIMDSVNQIKVSFILDNYGWLGPEVIGLDGNAMFYIVLGDASQSMCEKYVPMMFEAVKIGNADPQKYAILKDGVLLDQNKKQMYGSRIAYYMKDGQSVAFLRPLEDPDNVDKRRESIGLSSLAEYLHRHNIVWDLEQYKKDNP